MLTLLQVMEELAVSRATLCRWIKDGFLTPTGEKARLVAMRVGRGWRIRREDLEDFLAACQMPVIEFEILRPVDRKDRKTRLR